MVMISVTEAINKIRSTTGVLESENVFLKQASGRLLREGIKAPEDIPAFDRSAMDGYAVQASDDSKCLKVLGAIQPGETSSVKITRGTCVRIFTGAAIPEGASQVLMQEDVEANGAEIRPLRRSSVTHIRRKGEDARGGDILIPSGRKLSPVELAILASVGAVKPLVAKRPRIVHITTGHELVPAEQVPARNQIRDSNSTLIFALAETAGAEIMHQTLCGDDESFMLRSIQTVPAENYEMLLISGGASVGDFDFSKSVLQKLGFELHFTQVNLRPGKPMIFGTRGKQVGFGIPGNPVSHFVCFQLFIREAISHFLGLTEETRTVMGELANAIPWKKEFRETYWPGHWEMNPLGKLMFHPHAWASSGHLASLAGCTALMKVEAGTIPEKGSLVPILRV